MEEEDLKYGNDFKNFKIEEMEYLKELKNEVLETTNYNNTISDIKNNNEIKD